MIDALFELFRTLVDDPAEEETSDTSITLAAVALMLEVARADDGSADVEVDAIESILRARFQVEPVSIGQLIEAVGPERCFGELVPELGDAAFIDLRPVLAHLGIDARVVTTDADGHANVDPVTAHGGPWNVIFEIEAEGTTDTVTVELCVDGGEHGATHDPLADGGATHDAGDHSSHDAGDHSAHDAGAGDDHSMHMEM